MKVERAFKKKTVDLDLIEHLHFSINYKCFIKYFYNHSAFLSRKSASSPISPGKNQIKVRDQLVIFLTIWQVICYSKKKEKSIDT